MKNIVIFCAYLICFILQSCFGNSFAFFGFSPDLMTGMTAVIVFCRGYRQGVYAWMIFGFIRDICFGEIPGTSVLICLAAGIAMLVLRKKVYYDNYLVLFMVTFSVTLFHTVVSCAAGGLITGGGEKLLYWLGRVPVTAILNYLIVLIFKGSIPYVEEID